MLNLHRRQLPDPDDQLRRTELAIDQLERAALYVVQAAELDLESPAHSRALRRLPAPASLR